MSLSGPSIYHDFEHLNPVYLHNPGSAMFLAEVCQQHLQRVSVGSCSGIAGFWNTSTRTPRSSIRRFLTWSPGCTKPLAKNGLGFIGFSVYTSTLASYDQCYVNMYMNPLGGGSATPVGVCRIFRTLRIGGFKSWHEASLVARTLILWDDPTYLQPTF